MNLVTCVIINVSAILSPMYKIRTMCIRIQNKYIFVFIENKWLISYRMRFIFYQPVHYSCSYCTIYLNKRLHHKSLIRQLIQFTNRGLNNSQKQKLCPIINCHHITASTKLSYLLTCLLA